MKLLALALVASALAAQDPVDFSGWLNRGVQEFKAGRYPAAVAAFERATMIDPSQVSAQLYLGTAYMQQFIPGNESAENLRLGDAAQARFLRVLEIDGTNKVAIASIASLYLNRKKWDDAQQWYEKLAAADPSDAGAWYSMGFIAWSRWYPAYAKARAGLGLQPADPGPIQDAGVRADLNARYGTIIEGGLRALDKALQLNPQYADAMAYMNLLVRERADLRATSEDYKRDVAIADDWVRQALAAKRAQAEQRTGGLMAAPPPPPPPPPGAQGAIPQRIKIAGEVVERQRIRNVPPVYPELAKQAAIQGVVRLAVVIDKQGRVMNISVLSGHPLLIPAALDAVKQWEYNPTLLNGQPVEVATEVSVAFVL